MEKRVFLFDVEGRQALGFDTGLDSRAFARAKFAQFITEPGIIVNLDEQASSVSFWKASGVVEHSAMIVWGPPFRGERLDFLFDGGGTRDDALAAICRWMRAILALGDKYQAPLWPCAALIGEGGGSGAVFFAPPGLVSRCLMPAEAEKTNNRYVHPGLKGMNAAAFTAAAMLYRVFAGVPAFAAGDGLVLYEDMREGNFLPIRLAAPGLDDGLAALIQKGLGQNGKKGVLPDGTRLLEELLVLLRPGAGAVSPASFINSLSDTDKLSIEKEKTQYLKTKTAAVNTRRFVRRNAAVLLGAFSAVVIAFLIVNSVIKSRSALSTAGMEPVKIVESYYMAFEKLDHLWMEACVIKDAGKDDISMVMNLFILGKLRQAYEHSVLSPFISAGDWLESGGGQVDFQVFGVTDLRITYAGFAGAAGYAGETGETRYRADYTLWVPGEAADVPETERDAGARYVPPVPYRRTDFVTLVQKKGNWRISGIIRESGD